MKWTNKLSNQEYCAIKRHISRCYFFLKIGNGGNIIFAGMEINDALVKKLAGLARLNFTEEEFLKLRKELEQMTGFVEKLNELDTEGVEPLLFVSDTENVFREDEARQMISNEEALSNATDTVPPFFTAPKALQKPGV